MSVVSNASAKLHLLAVVAFLCIALLTFLYAAQTAFAETETLNQEQSGIMEAPATPWHTEGNATTSLEAVFTPATGTPSTIILSASAPVDGYLETLPRLITIGAGAASEPQVITFTLGGLLPDTTYHRYIDHYGNHAELVTDAAGGATFILDLSERHTIYIQPTKSTYFLTNGSGGGDCEGRAIGTWDGATKTCTLTKDLTETVQLGGASGVADGITLDGAGHTISGVTNGVYVYRVRNVTVTNIRIANGTNGIRIENGGLGPVTLSQITTINNSKGVYATDVSSTAIADSTADDQLYGVHLYSPNVVDSAVTLNNIRVTVPPSVNGQGGYTGIYLGMVKQVVARSLDITGGVFSIMLTGGRTIDIRQSAFRAYLQQALGLSYSLYWDSANEPDFEISAEADGKQLLYTSHRANEVLDAAQNPASILACFYCTDVTIQGYTFDAPNEGLRLVRTKRMLVQTNVFAVAKGGAINTSDTLGLVVRNNTFQAAERPLSFSYYEGDEPYVPAKLYHNKFLSGSLGTGVNWYNQLNHGDTLSPPLPLGGNWWEEYDESSEGCLDADANRICDEPYHLPNVSPETYDNLPWTSPDAWDATTTPPTDHTLVLTFPTDSPYEGVRGVASSGPNPERGVADKDTFTFQVVYTDAQNRVPTAPQAVITSAGGSQTISLYTDMTTASTTLKDGLFSNGELLTATSTFPKGAYTYHFETLLDGATVKLPSTADLSFKAGYDSVVFIPGAGASRLYDGEGEQRWEPESNLDAYALRMQNGVSVNTGIHTQDIIETSNIAPTGFNRDYYASFADSMRGLVDDGTIAGFDTMPYDWRYAVDTTASGDIALSFGSYRMLDKLHELAASSDSGRVTIVSHSMGGLIGKLLISKLEEQGKANEIGSFVMVAVPQLGTPKAVASLLHGEGQKIGFGAYLTNGAARELGHDMPNAYGLLPGGAYFDRITETAPTYGPALTAGVVTLDASLASLSNDSLFNGPALLAAYGTSIRDKAALDAFLRGDGGRTEWNTNDLLHPAVLNAGMLADAAALRRDKLDHWTAPANVRVVEIAGWGEETVAGVTYYKGLKTECAFLFIGCTTSDTLMYKPLVTLDGDGTVVEPSAMTMMEGAEQWWVQLGGDGGYNDGVLVNRDHADIFEVDQLPNLVQSIVAHNEPQLATYIEKSRPSKETAEGSIRLYLHSPLALDLYNDEGHHTGVSTTTGLVETNIPGSRYHTLGELKWITVPASTATHLVLRGEASGSFTLDVEKVTGDVVVASTTFAGVPSSTSTVVTLDIPAKTTIADMSPLSVDYDGDGTIDFSLTPRLDDVVLPDLTPPDTTAPTTPAQPSATSSTSTVTLTWPSSTDEGSGVAYYTVYKNGTVVGTTSALAYTDTRLSPSTAYSYTVSATDQAGNESAQSPARVGITKAVPMKVALSASASTIAGGTSATISWNVSGYTSCTKSGGWSGTLSPLQGSLSVTPTVTTTYKITCSAGGSTGSASVTVGVR